MRLNVSQTARLMAGVFTACLFLGCGGGGEEKTRVQVTGVVTYEGKPVTEGEVTFEADDGSAGTTMLDSEGKFALEGLPVGKYKVAIAPPPITEAPGDPATTKIKTYDNIPEGYHSIQTTDFTAEVKEEGPNEFKFDMVKGGGMSLDDPMQQAP